MTAQEYIKEAQEMLKPIVAIQVDEYKASNPNSDDIDFKIDYEPNTEQVNRAIAISDGFWTVLDANTFCRRYASELFNAA